MSAGTVRVTIVVKGREQVRVVPAGTRLELDTPSGIVGRRTWREVLGRDLVHVEEAPAPVSPAYPEIEADPAAEE